MLKGLYLPIITPMVNNSIDYTSYVSLLNRYVEIGVDGVIPLGTTGESPTITDDEVMNLIDLTVSTVDNRCPIYFGFGGNYTDKMLHQLNRYEDVGIEGLLCSSPYYNRPSQQGIIEHFKAIADSTSLDIIMYNIPYRTGRNMDNDTILRLAELDNIVALKDASGDMKQTTDMLLNKPEGFSVLCGEDYHLFSSLALGGDGGILASAHLNTGKYLELIEAFELNDITKARELWKPLAQLIPLLFKEPNPAPIKHLLMNQGYIQSDCVRMPLMSISSSLRDELNQLHPTLL